MTNPVTVENRFNELVQVLAQTQSIRHRTWLIYHFADSLKDELKKYDSYFLQLVPKLSQFTEPLTWSGLDPAELEKWADLFCRMREEIPELDRYKSFTANIRRLRQVTILQYGLLNELNGAYRNIRKHAETEIPNDTALRDVDLEELSVRDFDGFLFWIITAVPDLSAALKNFILEIQNEYRLIKTQQEDSGLLPVVEKYEAGDTVIAYGRLRSMTVDVRGDTEKEKDRFYRRFDTVGMEKSRWDIPENVMKSARQVILKGNPELWNRYFSGEISYRLSQALQAGSSSDAACAALLVAAIQKKVNKKNWMELAPNVCITGELDSEGNFKSVANESVHLKLEAAFFSWAEILVVPEGQLKQFVNARKELRDRYPERRSLTIIGVSSLEEVFFDRRITKLVQISKARFYRKMVWERKFTLLSVLIVLVLLGIIVRLITGPLDKNVVMADFLGTNMKLMNQFGFVVKTIPLEQGIINYLSETTASSPRVDFYDITGDGINEFFWTEGVSSAGYSNGMIMAWSVTGDSLIWRRELTFNPEFPRQQGLENMHFQVDQFHLTYDRNGDLKLIVNCDSGMNFPGVIAKLNAYSGEVEGHYLHTGKLRDLKLIDINGDGTDEIIAAGINNAFWQAAVTVLDIDKIDGHSPSRGDHMPNGIPRAEEIAYILIPKTMAGRVFDSVDKYSEALRIRNREVNSQFIVSIRDLPSREFREREYIPYLLYYFNYDFSLESIVTSDIYDIVMHELHRDGYLPFVPDYDYFEAFRDSLVWVE